MRRAIIEQLVSQGQWFAGGARRSHRSRSRHRKRSNGGARNTHRDSAGASVQPAAIGHTPSPDEHARQPSPEPVLEKAAPPVADASPTPAADTSSSTSDTEARQHSSRNRRRRVRQTAPRPTPESPSPKTEAPAGICDATPAETPSPSPLIPVPHDRTVAPPRRPTPSLNSLAGGKNDPRRRAATVTITGRVNDCERQPASRNVVVVLISPQEPCWRRPPTNRETFPSRRGSSVRQRAVIESFLRRTVWLSSRLIGVLPVTV